MASYYEQLKTVKRLKVPEGISRRYNCPFCNGYNTLSVSNIGGVIEWNCFKASCDARGIHEDGRSLEAITKAISKSGNETDSVSSPVPDFISPVLRDEHVEWLKSVHSYEAYEKGYVDIMYAPKEERLLFSANNGKGWIGRKFGKYGPKWMKYGQLAHLFACGTGSIGVLVEDAPSACAVGVVEGYTGLALLSTNLTKQHTLDISPYEKIYVCLDPDATRKSIQISKALDGFKQNRVVLIPDDLKYYNPTQIMELLK